MMPARISGRSRREREQRVEAGPRPDLRADCPGLVRLHQQVGGDRRSCRAVSAVRNKRLVIHDSLGQAYCPKVTATHLELGANIEIMLHRRRYGRVRHHSVTRPSVPRRSHGPPNLPVGADEQDELLRRRSNTV